MAGEGSTSTTTSEAAVDDQEYEYHSLEQAIKSNQFFSAELEKEKAEEINANPLMLGALPTGGVPIVVWDGNSRVIGHHDYTNSETFPKLFHDIIRSIFGRTQCGHRTRVFPEKFRQKCLAGNIIRRRHLLIVIIVPGRRQEAVSPTLRHTLCDLSGDLEHNGLGVELRHRRRNLS